jgi:hypothetical protein
MTAASDPQAEARGPSTGLTWQWQVAVVAAAVLVVFSRQPDALLHAQFFAEDGRYWFADAYNHGWWTSLFQSKDGYFQTLPRIAAALALLVPLRFAPLVMNLTGLLVQILPAPVLLSSRFSAWGSLALRAAMAFTYLAMPNCSEMNVTIEEGQWHLALVACLLLLSSPPATRFWKIFDLKTFLVCGLSGPFAILLLPIAILRLRPRRDPFSRWPLVILLSTAALQAFTILSTPRERWPLGASFDGLIRIVSGQVFLGTILGSNTLGARDSLPFLLCVAIAGACVLIYCFLHASSEWKLFLLFCFLLLAASLRSPFTPDLAPGTTAWAALARTPGIRYWFLPTVACTWTIVWYLLARPPRRSRQAIGAALLLLMLIGFVRDFRIPPRKDLHFASYADIFEASPHGTVMTIPINPPGWDMQLVKH